MFKMHIMTNMRTFSSMRNWSGLTMLATVKPSMTSYRAKKMPTYVKVMMFMIFSILAWYSFLIYAMPP